MDEPPAASAGLETLISSSRNATIGLVTFAASKTGAGVPGSCGRALAGFLLSGFLMALLGAILPAWGYHRDPPDFFAVGNYFLSLAAGIVAAAAVARPVLTRKGITFLLVLACSLACAALIYLAAVSPMFSVRWRAAGLLTIGISIGLLNVGLFHAVSPAYHGAAAATVTRGGIWYGLGCLTATLLVAGTFYAYTVPAILIFMAAVPAVFGVIYARSECTFASEGAQPSLREALKD